MRKGLLVTICMMTMAAFASTCFADMKGTKIDAAAEFKEHCAICHPDGGNIINSKKTLKKMDLQANGIKSAKDIVKNMRKPGPGMTAFDEKAISAKEAKAIAEYILKTFK